MSRGRREGAAAHAPKSARLCAAALASACAAAWADPHPVKVLKDALAPARSWFFSDAWSAALAWFCLATALIAILAWFFVLSSYGTPAAPAYAAY